MPSPEKASILLSKSRHRGNATPGIDQFGVQKSPIFGPNQLVRNS